MAVYLLRHGALPPNPRRCFVGQRDLPLTPIGQRQIAFWAEELARVPLRLILCSTLQRCRDTARIIGSRHPHTPVTPSDAFREISLGRWEGLTPAEVEERFPGAYAERGRRPADYRPHGGESFRMLARRVLPALRDALPPDPEEPVLLAAHGGVIRVILAYALALPLERLLEIPQPYAACTRLETPPGFFDALPLFLAAPENA
ncbi:histidine phosphatase family protein [uncultured Desulfovibrio sp.]|uniref:histidine phosphatase family protein n=1 Tax=uncultured Desulfovibrio sp. TaxID=167968 RepID=UPI002633C0B9|nr:histidine phosphatase family protein [uncultured Desulfovibrio sp.]